MKKEKTKKGNLFFTLKGVELKRMGMGACMNDGGPHEVICAGCNGLIEDEDDCYFVPVMNDVFCKDCKDEVENFSHYKEDEEYEAESARRFQETYEYAVEGGVDMTGKKNIFISVLQ